MVAAANPALFNNRAACGQRYRIRCHRHEVGTLAFSSSSRHLLPVATVGVQLGGFAWSPKSKRRRRLPDSLPLSAKASVLRDYAPSPATEVSSPVSFPSLPGSGVRGRC
ncbi:hypothetical protein SASPL_112066 [Salvia splendens]|uniref:Uncharacterized protein n=1 Tax=Salvia splendens TaxID=180675 RepID=A0A8X8YA28_SALSN|nr:hypothetical protein SASPL_112066 [Salvia splendens]